VSGAHRNLPGCLSEAHDAIQKPGLPSRSGPATERCRLRLVADLRRSHQPYDQRRRLNRQVRLEY
jgi:hypothetical protein